MEKHILVDETTDEDSYQLFITMSIKSESYEYVLESQPLYETDGENPDADIDAILLFTSNAEDVAEEFGMPCEVSSVIKADIAELQELKLTGK